MRCHPGLFVLLGCLACSDPATSTDAGSADSSADAPSPCSTITAPAAFHGSCRSGDSLVPTCEDLSGSAWANPTTSEQACVSNAGIFSATEHCATDKLIGRCLMHCGAPSEVVSYVYSGELAAAQVGCVGPGEGRWLGL